MPRAVAAVVLMAGTLAACGDERSARATDAPEPQPQVAARIEIESGDYGADAVAVGDGAVWVAGGPFLHRIDSARNHLSARLPLGEWAHDVATSEGAVWVAGEREVLRIDPARLEVVARVPLPRPGYTGGIDTGHGAVWVSVSHGPRSGEVVRIDPRTGSVAARIPADGWVGELDAGAGAVWVLGHPDYRDETDIAETSLHRVDPATNALETVAREPGVMLGGSEIARVLAAGRDAVWVQAFDPEHPYGGEAIRVDAVGGTVTRRELGVERFFPFAVTERGVWFMGPRSQLSLLDTRTMQVGGSIELDATVVDADRDAAGGALWLAAPSFRRDEPSHVLRVDVR